MDKCLICNENDATKKNSHLIPSFLVAMVVSYNHSYKRDKELMITISPHQSKIYTGALPDTKLEQIFDTANLSEERIANELSKNTVAVDYIFCPTCENNLSRYLETPYSSKIQRNETVSNDVPLFFWLSIVWRMSVNGNHGFKLPSDIEEMLHNNLNTFFQLKEKGDDVNPLIEKVHFNYRIVSCKDYCKSNGGYIYSLYNKENNVLTVMIGDICICVTFDEENLPEDYSFFGLEKHINEAPCNNGKEKEITQPVSNEDYKSSVQEFVQYGASIRKREDFELLDYIWKSTGRFFFMPIKMKLKFMEILYDDKIKLGERHTPQRYVEIFNYLIDNVWIWY
jgi:hypothetical protein